MKNINLHEDTEVGQAFELGLRDAYIEKYLRKCEHLDVRFHTSLLGNEIGLLSIDAKAILCTKFKDYIMKDISLESLYLKFESSFCQSCSGCKPRPENWKYTVGFEKSRFPPGHLDLINI